MLERLNQALERLEANKRALWQALAASKKLRQISREQGISYDAVKRQRRQLFVHLSTNAVCGDNAEQLALSVGKHCCLGEGRAKIFEGRECPEQKRKRGKRPCK